MDHSYESADSGQSGKFLCQADLLVEGEFRELETRLDDRPIFLVATRHQGVVRAWLNVCPHQGRSLNWAPDRFLTDDQGNLVCAHHGAVFVPDRGHCISGPCQNAELTPVPLHETNGRVFLQS